MWVRISLPSLKLQILDLFWARSFFFHAITWSKFTLKRVCDMITTLHPQYRAQSFKASLAILVSVYIWTKWSWVRIPLLSLKWCMARPKKKCMFVVTRQSPPKITDNKRILKTSCICLLNKKSAEIYIFCLN